MEIVKYNGWKNCVRLSNGKVEAIITTDVGPRIMRFAFIKGKNLFAELPGQQGKSGEKNWMIRGGHRLWMAPEDRVKTYELDNSPVPVQEIMHGILTLQPAGPHLGIARSMEITLSPGANAVKIIHTLTNKSGKSVEVAPWALSAMAIGGTAVIPLPKKISHTKRLTHNQSWSLWGYTHLGDPRWTFGERYILFRQDKRLGPNKLGMAHKEGWVAYMLGDILFVKKFKHIEGAEYPDGGMNFETFSNEQILELESIGPLVKLAPGKNISHVEEWSLHKGLPKCRTEKDIDRHILPRVR